MGKRKDQYLLDLINADRAEVGAAPLTLNAKLDNAADAHTQWMLATDSFSHIGDGNSRADQRIAATGYAAVDWAENIAYASDGGKMDNADVAHLHEILMNSAGHRANLLDSSPTEIGIGLKHGDFGGRSVAMLTEDFGTSNWRL